MIDSIKNQKITQSKTIVALHHYRIVALNIHSIKNHCRITSLSHCSIKYSLNQKPLSHYIIIAL